MNRNVPNNNESPLLLQLPKSVLSFSDMSGNSFLLPVAVDNVVATENSAQNVSTTSITEASSVCQLQQPLLMRRGSSGQKMAVPYSESSVPTTSVESIQAGISSLQTSVPDSAISQPIVTQNWSTSTAGPPPSQPNPVYSDLQNQPPLLQSESVHQLHSSSSASFNQQNLDIGQQTVHSHDSAISSVNSYSNDNRAFMTTLPTSQGQQSEFFNVASSPAYLSQPPVITPSSSPAYQSSFVRDMSQIPQVPYVNTSNQNFTPQSTASSTFEFYSRIYEPVKPYWLFLDIVESKEVWCGFSETDSNNLETAFQQDSHAVVPVDGGRYDAYLSDRIKRPVYFEAKDLQISRGTWFYRKGTSQRFIPFPEGSSEMLEEHYSSCVTSGQWQKRVNVPLIGSVVMENPHVLLYYKNEVEVWPTLPDSKAYPQPVRRGLPENFESMEDQNEQIDHLVFIVQGIGSFCDLRFRTVAECVDGFRDISNKLMSIHFKHELEAGRVGRVEFLPLAWHAKLHTSDKGFDRCMKTITLPSIPKLRHFTNDTLLDILLYSSPTYCQTIIDTVASELNKLYEIFLRRNPGFSGSVFVAGHSLGSLILFDILSNQTPKDESNMQSIKPSNELPIEDQKSESVIETDNNEVPCKKNLEDLFESVGSFLQTCQLEEYLELFEKEKIDLSSLPLLSDADLKDLGMPTGPRKKLLNAIQSHNEKSSEVLEDVSPLPSTSASSQNEVTCKAEMQEVSDSNIFGFPLKASPCMSSIKYPKLQFEPACFFALGSPISMFLTVRGYEFICEDFRFPTCPSFFHIFHPYDPVAFRIEPLIEPTFSAKPVLIPHHKGRKRMHLENWLIKLPNGKIVHVGHKETANLLYMVVLSTLRKSSAFSYWKIRENLSKVGSEIKQKVLETLRYTWDSLSIFAKSHTFSAAVEAEVDKLVKQQMTDAEYETQAPSETSGEEIQIGSLNGGRRIDYVLQEKPIEALNDYIFALTSHATYWDSEDTVLMILREIYATQGVLVSSPLEVKYSPPEKSLHENFAKMATVMSDPSLYQSSSSQMDFQSTRGTPYFDPSLSVPPSGRSEHDSMGAYCEAAMSMPQALNTVPPPAGCASAQSFRQTPTFPPSVRPPSVSLPSAPVSQPVGPPPAPATQPLGPPPLTGFVKRSPFNR